MNGSNYEDLCDRFEASWRNGPPLAIEDVLTEQTKPVRRRGALKVIKTDTPTKEILTNAIRAL